MEALAIFLVIGVIATIVTLYIIIEGEKIVKNELEQKSNFKTNLKSKSNYEKIRKKSGNKT